MNYCHKVLILLLLTISSIISCTKDKPEDFKMDSQGPLGEIMVVSDKEQLKNGLGEAISSTLQAPYKGLPTEEASFKLDSIPHKLFGGYMTRHRNIFQVNISPKAKNKLVAKDDLFAFNQNYMILEAKSDTSAIRILNQNKDKILEYFQQGEIKRFSKTYEKEHSVISDSIEAKLGFTVSSANFGLKRNTNNFAWMSKETKRTSLAIMLYSIPYVSKEQFSKDSLIATKNRFMKKYVEGPEPKSYLSVEKVIPITTKISKVNGRYTVKVNGSWTLIEGFMGGPFVLYATLDEDNQRIIMLDSYIFAPEHRFSRVDLLREAEGIFHTLKIKKK